jgi:DNA-binding NarL/FixJ family response regulator
VASWLYAKEKVKEEVLPLTSTEKEILRAMALGKSTKEIASERFLSVYTVMTHRKNIFRKLCVNNAHEAIRYALRAGLVDIVEYYI